MECSDGDLPRPNVLSVYMHVLQLTRRAVDVLSVYMHVLQRTRRAVSISSRVRTSAVSASSICVIGTTTAGIILTRRVTLHNPSFCLSHHKCTREIGEILM